jgi:hypothetical protein
MVLRRVVKHFPKLTRRVVQLLLYHHHHLSIKLKEAILQKVVETRSTLTETSWGRCATWLVVFSMGLMASKIF